MKQSEIEKLSKKIEELIAFRTKERRVFDEMVAAGYMPKFGGRFTAWNFLGGSEGCRIKVGQDGFLTQMSYEHGGGIKTYVNILFGNGGEMEFLLDGKKRKKGLRDDFVTYRRKEYVNSTPDFRQAGVAFLGKISLENVGNSPIAKSAYKKIERQLDGFLKLARKAEKDGYSHFEMRVSHESSMSPLEKAKEIVKLQVLANKPQMTLITEFTDKHFPTFKKLGKLILGQKEKLTKLGVQLGIVKEKPTDSIED